MHAVSEPILQVTDLVKRFPIKAGFFGGVVATVDAVSGVSFSVNKGETLGLVGESGCGKSTTARAILRLHEPDSGSIIFDGRDVMALDKNELRTLRREMQIVFQDPYASLNPRWQINNIVGEPLAVHEHGLRPSRRASRRVAGPRRPQPRARQPLPARVLRWSAATHRHRPCTGAGSEIGGARRAGIGT